MNIPDSPSGVIFNILRFSLHDGPGIRTTVFLKGCPLRCWWCHNPESQSFEPEVMYYQERCRQCGDCVDACPHGALSRADGVIAVSEDCEACGTCVDVCRTNARMLAGRRMTVPQVIAEIEKDVIFFDESGGGVTFSGGEPLAQPQFLEALLRACRERRIHTAIDTCGFAQRDLLLRLSALADVVLYDLKLVDTARHIDCTGVSNQPILENLKALADAHRTVIVRYPVIPGINDADEQLHLATELLAQLGLRRLDLLPYHSTGAEKYRRLRMSYALPDVATPPAARIEEIAEVCRREGLAVTVGG